MMTVSLIEELLDEADNLERTVTALEAQQKQIEKRRRQILEELIPNALEDMGQEGAILKGGRHVTVKDKIRATPLKENREQVYAWLEEHGHGHIIKRKVVFPFAMGEEEKARALMDQFADQIEGAHYEKKVESPTMNAFVREELEKGTNLPMGLFNVHVQRITDVKVK
jgi:hypothetical protein